MYIIKSTNKKYALFILGAGGTGSWLATFLSRMQLGNDIVVFDGDIVEPKNVLRQNFSLSHVNKPKAEVVANTNSMSYVNTFITDSQLLHDVLSEFSDDTIPIIVGCLDNNASRKIAHDFMHEVKDGIWIDGGNAERHGQAYICIKEDNQFIEPFLSPIDIDPYFQNFEGDERRPDQISCAEQSESAPQNVTANVTSATVLFNILAIILNGGMFLSNKVVFNTTTLSMTPQIDG